MMKSRDGLWKCDYKNREQWCSLECFSTKEEAIKVGTEALKKAMEKDPNCVHDYKDVLGGKYGSFVPYYFYVGQLIRVGISINTETIIENLADQIYESGIEVGEDYLSSLTLKEELALESKLNNAFWEWAKETNNEPDYYTIEQIEKINWR